MDERNFTKQRTGRLVRIPEGTWAFVPDPLPPKLEIDLETARELSDAERAIGELAGVGKRLPNREMFVRPFSRREAVLSSRIEGTTTSLQQLALFEANAVEESQREDAGAVANYLEALEYGLERVKGLPASLRLLRELHERLMRGVRGHEERPGEFRDVQNYIGRGRSIEQARFVPPPVGEMHQALDAFERFLASPNGFPPLIHLALVHYQFEAIHPFRDGNGRIGRLLIALLLCAQGHYQAEALLPGPLLYLSASFERNRDAYYDHLLHVSARGAWIEWVRFFLRGIAEQSKDALVRSQRLLDLRDQYRERVQTVRASALLPRLVDALFASPVITARRAQRLLDVTPRSAILNIRKLQGLGIVEEITGRERYQVYVATAILNIAQEDIQ